MVEAALLLLLKPDPTGNITHHALKFSPFCTAQVPLMKEFVPHAKVYFVTRNAKKTMLVSAISFFALPDSGIKSLAVTFQSGQLKLIGYSELASF